jgi:hypothetical protein
MLRRPSVSRQPAHSPPAPDFSNPLSHPGLFVTLQAAAAEIGYRLG